MEYLPYEYVNLNLPSVTPDSLIDITSKTLCRNVRLLKAKWNTNKDRMAFFCENTSSCILVSDVNMKMKFADETITAYEYLIRVLEKGDSIDLIANPSNIYGQVELEIFWITINYFGEENASSTYRKKDDGLFALRAKSGEKAERIVAKDLVDNFGHSFSQDLLNPPGAFNIWYQGKKIRKPDRVCTKCKLHFEVKKRNKDYYFRVSHSDARRFDKENSQDGWHAFVFPTMEISYLSNASIINALNEGRFTASSDRYDAWADIINIGPEDVSYLFCK